MMLGLGFGFDFLDWVFGLALKSKKILWVFFGFDLIFRCYGFNVCLEMNEGICFCFCWIC